MDAILVASSTILFFALFSVYNVNLTIGVIILAREIFTFAIDPIYSLNIDYLQLEYSSSITAINKAVGYMLRFACSFIPSPYCLSIGGIVEAVYLLVSNQIIRSRHFKLQKDGTFIRRIVKPKAEKNV